ncbi:MAG TPA: polysaccharide deacetylase family protein [Methylocella sp.]|nr:polysaccharide deacetylase family protein [Methylocella sp.]
MEDYSGRRKPVTLPGGARICVSVTIAFEGFLYHSHYNHSASKPGQKNPFSLSYGDYAAKVGVWRILDVLERNGITATFDIGGLAAERHPHVMRALRDGGHEAAGHGWANDVRVDENNPEAELKQIRDTLAAIAAGYGERPVGWVSQGSVGSTQTWQMCADEGMLWNGDDASEDMPFVRLFGGKPMVILPRVNFPTNDLIVWQQPQNPPSAYYEGFKETFDYLYEEGKQGSPKWVDLLLHSDIGGRPTLIGAFERALKYAKQTERVWFARRRDLAAQVLKQEQPKHATARTA